MRLLVPVALVAAAMAALLVAPASGEPARLVPAMTDAPRSTAASETAIFAGGCFWGVEAVFERVKGVRRAVSGYAGGRDSSPTYAEVTSGTTGAAEAVRVDFDPRVVSYADLMRVYFSVVADPTQVNRQGPDRGTQYRTAFFPTSASQAAQARAYIAQLTKARAFERPIATRIEGGRFVAAEAYHQDYLRRHPDQPYIVMHDLPKLAALRRLFPAMTR